MVEEINKEQLNADKNDAPATLTEKIVAALLIGYVISLIWLTGSSHWFGIW